MNAPTQMMAAAVPLLPGLVTPKEKGPFARPYHHQNIAWLWGKLYAIAGKCGHVAPPEYICPI
jgi:hypothetical protein